jgi:hypothetical protein
MQAAQTGTETPFRGFQQFQQQAHQSRDPREVALQAASLMTSPEHLMQANKLAQAEMIDPTQAAGAKVRATGQAAQMNARAVASAAQTAARGFGRGFGNLAQNRRQAQAIAADERRQATALARENQLKQDKYNALSKLAGVIGASDPQLAQEMGALLEAGPGGVDLAEGLLGKSRTAGKNPMVKEINGMMMERDPRIPHGQPGAWVPLGKGPSLIKAEQEKTAEDAADAEKKKAFSETIGGSIEALMDAIKADALTVPGEHGKNIWRYLQSPEMFGGHLAGLGFEGAQTLQTWESRKAQILGQLRGLQGLGVRGMDTPAELLFYMNQIGSMKLHPLTNLALVDALERQYGGVLEKGRTVFTIDRMFDAETVQAIRGKGYKDLLTKVGSHVEGRRYLEQDTAMSRSLQTGTLHLPDQGAVSGGNGWTDIGNNVRVRRVR